MSARDEVLSNIRRSLGVTGAEATRRGIVDDRLKAAARGPVPARGQGDAAQRLATFVSEAERVSATVDVLDTMADVPAAVARYLHAAQLPLTLRLGADARLAGLGFEAAGFTVTVGPSAGDDPVALSHAFAGVAETGSLVILSGSDNPATLNYLPDTHLVLLRDADLCADLESVWTRLRQRGPMPRTVNVVTGPSRSADIEQKLLLGAHGPRALHILVARS